MRGRPIETAEQTIPLFVFVWLSDNRRFVLLILALVLVLLLFVTIVVDWVSRRHSVAGEAQPSETVSRVALDHVGPIRAARMLQPCPRTSGPTLYSAEMGLSSCGRSWQILDHHRLSQCSEPFGYFITSSALARARGPSRSSRLITKLVAGRRGRRSWQ